MRLTSGLPPLLAPLLLVLGGRSLDAQTRDKPAPADPPAASAPSNDSAEAPAADAPAGPAAAAAEAKPPAELPPPLPIDVALLRPDSLAGWTHAATPPSGWSIENGRLTGQDGATPLLSGFTMGEFDLSFRWTAGEAAVLQVQLPPVGGGPSLSVNFSESAACGRIDKNGKQVAPGQAAAPTDQPHTAKITRAGGDISVTVDGREVSRTEIAADARFGLGLAVHGGQVTVEDLRLQEPLGSPIFNGTDLSGWWCPGRMDAWQAVDGMLVLAGRGGNYLRTEKLYGNFTLSLEFKIKKNGNSGLGIRTPRDGWPSGDGMELQWLDSRNADKGGMMSIYRNVPPLAVAHRSEQWNHLVVKAEGRMITAWMNGELVQQVNTAWEPELKHRNLKGWIGFQDHGAKIEVRHLRLSEAPDGLGLSAWYEPRPESAIDFVFRRLMNTERLTRDDGSAGTITTAHVDDRGIHQLAEWEGPGALVRFTSDNPDSQLVFYFDGEEQPRLKCTARDLAGQVPRLPGARGSQPVLTCVPFAQHLRVEVVECAPTTYRFECVRLPQTVEVTSFERGKTKIPESLAAALDYRVHHHAHGTVRQYAPYERITSDRRTLEPDEEADWVNVDGAGLVQWIQLHGPKQCLQTDDLWIEITTDNEKRPTVSAPVRFFFSGAAVAGSHANFLFTDRGGPFNRLAVPFGKGLRISLVNRGESPISGVGVTASVQLPTDDRQGQDFANRLRLRGAFRDEGNEPGEGLLFEQTGRGRLVALVWEAAAARLADGPAGEPDKRKPVDGKPEKEETFGGDLADDEDPANAQAAVPAEAAPEQPPPPTIELVEIDGRPPRGWQPATLDVWLGRPGQTGDFRGLLSGRQGDFTWRNLLLAPLDFDQGISAAVSPAAVAGKRLALFYAE